MTSQLKTTSATLYIAATTTMTLNRPPKPVPFWEFKFNLSLKIVCWFWAGLICIGVKYMTHWEKLETVERYFPEKNNSQAPRKASDTKLCLYCLICLCCVFSNFFLLCIVEFIAFSSTHSSFFSTGFVQQVNFWVFLVDIFFFFTYSYIRC